jgi:fibrillarin-like rRNA methylase
MKEVKELQVVTLDGEKTVLYLEFASGTKVDVNALQDVVSGFEHFTVEFLLDVVEKRIRMEMKKYSDDLFTDDIETIDDYTNEFMDVYREITQTDSDSDDDDLAYSQYHDAFSLFLEEE